MVVSPSYVLLLLRAGLDWAQDSIHLMVLQDLHEGLLMRPFYFLPNDLNDLKDFNDLNTIATAAFGNR